MERFVKRMNEVERANLTSPYVRPKDAATPDSGRPRPAAVPQGPASAKRPSRSQIHAGEIRPFPAGRVDPADRKHAGGHDRSILRPEAHLMKRLQRPSAAKGTRVSRSAAIPRDVRGDRPPPRRARPRHDKGPAAGRGSRFAAANILPDLGALHFIGRAITPPGRPPRRFRRAPSSPWMRARSRSASTGVIGPDAELVELVWMPLKDAKQLDMPAVTGVMLEELDARIARRLRPRAAGSVLQACRRGALFRRDML